ncbi:hypothetical protein A6P39_005025 [Streptomyces sp. FXJ1.172]|uniref:hypothetical protein n=1 Tax=Streptomyces sp. FXJ1.172 TaxID=710705 RepID=UPI0007D01097|nr:hypothetical protein [Streptomyces sp. FXJ1.172]WEO93433.1 hypothetical protein A6P39_005025 [Streptomyces sp. FXJ1.172]
MVQFNQFPRGRRAAATGLITALGATIVICGSAAAGSGKPSAAAHLKHPFASSPGSFVGTPAPRQVSEPALRRIPQISKRGQHLTMPIDAYQTSTKDIALIGSASDEAAHDCMRSLGYRSWTTSTLTTSDPDKGKESDLLDYLDPTTVRHSGYPNTLTVKQASSAPRSKASNITPNALHAFLGSASRTATGASIPRGGCLREGERRVEGTTTELPADPRLLSAQAKGAALHDSRMRKAVATWSACMAQGGLRYTDPLSAQNDARWGRRPSSSAASEEEKRVAYADSRCQQKINLVGLYKALEASYEQQYINANKQNLDLSLRIFRTWVDNARKIVAVG